MFHCSINPVLFIHSIDGHVGCFPLLAILNSATMNTDVTNILVPIFNSFGSIT